MPTFRRNIQDTIEDGILSGTIPVRWAGDGMPQATHRVILSVVSQNDYHNRHEFDLDAETERQDTGWDAIVQVVCESNHANPDVGDAWALAEQIRFGLWRKSIRDSLNALGIRQSDHPGGLLTLSPETSPSWGVAVQRVYFEARFRYVSSYEQAPAGGVDAITEAGALSAHDVVPLTPAPPPDPLPVESLLPPGSVWFTADASVALRSFAPDLIETAGASVGGVILQAGTNAPRLDLGPDRYNFNVLTNVSPTATTLNVTALPAAVLSPTEQYVSLWKRLEDTPQDMVVLGMGQTGSNRRFFLRLSAAQGLRTLFYNPAQAQASVDLPIATVPHKRDQWQRWEVSYRGAATPRLRIWVDGVSVYAGAGPDGSLYSGTDCGLTLGNWSAGITTPDAFQGSIEGLVLSPTTPGDAERTALGVSTDPRGKVPQGLPEDGVNVLFFGNSWLFGYDADDPGATEPPATGPGPQLQTLLNAEDFDYLVQIESEPGVTTRNLARINYPVVGKSRVAGAKNIAVVLELHNDAVSTGDPNDLHLWVQQLCTRLRDDGWAVVVCTAPPSVAHPPSNPSDVVIQANALVRAQWPAYADALVDLALVPEWQTPGVGANPAEYKDNTHFTTQGYGRMAGYIYTGVIAAT